MVRNKSWQWLAGNDLFLYICHQHSYTVMSHFHSKGLVRFVISVEIFALIRDRDVNKHRRCHYGGSVIRLGYRYVRFSEVNQGTPGAFVSRYGVLCRHSACGLKVDHKNFIFNLFNILFS